MIKNFRLLTIFFIMAFVAAACDSSSDNDSGNNSPGDDETTETVVAQTEMSSHYAIGEEATATIGSLGGEISSGDAVLTLTVPPGAVDTNTEFSLQRCANSLGGNIGATYLVEPSGVTFNEPITLTFSLPALYGDFINNLSVMSRNDDDGYWSWLPEPTRDEEAVTLTTTATHFSPVGVTRLASLIPLSGRIHTKKSVTLKMASCYLKKNEDTKVYYSADCSAFPNKIKTVSIYNNWVNLGEGNSTYGYITGVTDYTITYRAPSKVPADNPSVMIKAYGEETSYYENDYAFSVLLITDDLPVYEGTFKFVDYKASGELLTAGHGSVTLTGTQEGEELIVLTPSNGTVTLDYGKVGSNYCFPPEGEDTKDISFNNSVNIWKNIMAYPDAFDFSGISADMYTLNCEKIGTSYLGAHWFTKGSDIEDHGVPILDPTSLSGESYAVKSATVGGYTVYEACKVEFNFTRVK